MNNCLCLKLKSSVQRDDLFKLTDVIFNLYEDTYITSAKLVSAKANASGCTFRIIGNAYFMDSSSVPQGKTLNVGASSVSFYIYSPDNNSKLIISDPENLVSVDFVYVKLSPVNDVQLQRLTAIEKFASASSSFSADISNLSNKANLNGLTVVGLTGNVSSLVNTPNLTFISTTSGGNKLSGDAALVADNIILIITGSTLSYTTRATTKKAVILNGGVNIGDRIDAYFNNFVECVDPGNPSFKVISVAGTRTSSSDAAVATLKSRGYTVKVNGETL